MLRLSWRAGKIGERVRNRIQLRLKLKSLIEINYELESLEPVS